jgi:hypothetical protein
MSASLVTKSPRSTYCVAVALASVDEVESPSHATTSEAMVTSDDGARRRGAMRRSMTTALALPGPEFRCQVRDIVEATLHRGRTGTRLRTPRFEGVNVALGARRIRLAQANSCSVQQRGKNGARLPIAIQRSTKRQRLDV